MVNSTIFFCLAMKWGADYNKVFEQEEGTVVYYDNDEFKRVAKEYYETYNK